VVETVVIYSKRLCVGRFGDDLAQRLTLTDEREPFGKIYRSREDFDMLIHGQER